MLSGMSWKANSSMEKFQNSRVVGEWCTDFLEYLLPRLLPSYERLACVLVTGRWPHRLTQTSKPFSTKRKGSAL